MVVIRTLVLIIICVEDLVVSVNAVVQQTSLSGLGHEMRWMRLGKCTKGDVMHTSYLVTDVDARHGCIDT